jgi:hypothetical protein
MYIFSVHPRYKHDVGYRLSRSGLAVAYGQQVEFQGPIVQNVAYSSGGQTISITYGAVSGIELRNPAGFEVYAFLFHRIAIIVSCILRFVVKEVVVQLMLHGLHQLYQVKVI